MILKVEVIEGGTNNPTVTRELTGEELEEWKKAHGYNTDTENQSDTE